MADAAGNDRYGRDLHEVRYVHDELLALVDRLPERDFAGPSLLAGWTRAHVAAHLVHNAEGLTRLATWARTGVETPMYASAESRAADIDHTARHRPADIREKLAAACTHLVLALDDLPVAARSVEVQSLLPPAFPAALLPWQRVRECWVHLVDLDAGEGFGAVPAPVQAALLDEAAERSIPRGVEPAVAVVDEGGTWWQLGDGLVTTTLTGPRPALLAWLTGRDGGAAGGLVATDPADAAVPVPGPPPWP
ncbi:MAG: maleylpyruvate isomerase family mycothiol-dependent enzyme [Microthrixaceae bacterium]|nr:maleylpyruvate isomerase family mycothiol-dependent enzyme [Microthrixaceae bacterium]